MYVSGLSAYIFNHYVLGFFAAISAHFIRNKYYQKVYLATIFTTFVTWSFFRIDSNVFFPYAIGPGIVLFNFTIGHYLINNLDKFKI